MHLLYRIDYGQNHFSPSKLAARKFFSIILLLDFRYVFLGTKTSCCVSDVQPNCNYMFRVKAQNIAGVSIVICAVFLKSYLHFRMSLI